MLTTQQQLYSLTQFLVYYTENISVIHVYNRRVNAPYHYTSSFSHICYQETKDSLAPNIL